MRGPRIVALGDSVSAGVGDEVPEGGARGWTAHLAALLGGPPPTILAEYGSRVRDVRTVQLPLALTSGAEIATLLVGGNDMLRLGFEAEGRAREIADVVDSLEAAGMLVVVVLLPDPGRSLPSWLGDVSAVLSFRARSLNRALHSALDGRADVVVVDPTQHEESASRSMWHTDRMHPSPVGHRMLAQLVAARLGERGYPVLGAMTPTSVPDTSVPATLSWALRTGLPWIARRSVDLVPELGAVVLSDRRAARADGVPRDG